VSSTEKFTDYGPCKNEAHISLWNK